MDFKKYATSEEDYSDFEPLYRYATEVCVDYIDLSNVSFLVSDTTPADYRVLFNYPQLNTKQRTVNSKKTLKRSADKPTSSSSSNKTLKEGMDKPTIPSSSSSSTKPWKFGGTEEQNKYWTMLLAKSFPTKDNFKVKTEKVLEYRTFCEDNFGDTINLPDDDDKFFDVFVRKIYNSKQDVGKKYGKKFVYNDLSKEQKETYDAELEILKNKSNGENKNMDDWNLGTANQLKYFNMEVVKYLTSEFVEKEINKKYVDRYKQFCEDNFPEMFPKDKDDFFLVFTAQVRKAKKQVNGHKKFNSGGSFIYPSLTPDMKLKFDMSLAEAKDKAKAE